MSFRFAIIAVAALMTSVAAQGTITALPAQESTSTDYSAGTYDGGLAATSYSYSYTYTTATTVWQAPTFATPRPIPACSDAMCPTYAGATCQDAEGVVYGIICNQRLGGIVIVDRGRVKAIKEREAGAEPGGMVVEEEVFEGELVERDVLEGEGEVEKRAYTGNFVGCTSFCNTYNSSLCVGVSYERGSCLAFAAVSGNFAGPGFAALRLT